KDYPERSRTLLHALSRTRHGREEDRAWDTVRTERCPTIFSVLGRAKLSRPVPIDSVCSGKLVGSFEYAERIGAQTQRSKRKQRGTFSTDAVNVDVSKRLRRRRAGSD